MEPRAIYNSETGSPLVFLPGWGFDRRTISDQPWWMAWAVFADVSSPAAAVDRLAAQLDVACIERVDLCGWSLGARVALDFVAAWPHRVRRVLLASVRPVFPRELIAQQRNLFERRAPTYLASFYRRALADQWEEIAARFSFSVSPDWLTAERIASLAEGLEYLAARTVTAAELARCSAQLFHGGRDLIAPVAELQECLSKLSAEDSQRVTLHVEPTAGHVPVVTPAFADWLVERTSA